MSQQPDHPVMDSPLQATLERWFVQYNPLYFASAALVLAGAWQLSWGLAEAGFRSGRIIPLGVLELYQIALIAAVMVLMARANLIRPAVMLGLIEGLFLLDPTHELARIALQADPMTGRLACGVWALMVPLLIYGSLAALRLRPSAETVLAPTLAATGMAAGTFLLDARAIPLPDAYLLLAALGIGLAVRLFRRPPALEPGGDAFEGWALIVRDRAARGLAALWVFS